MVALSIMTKHPEKRIPATTGWGPNKSTHRNPHVRFEGLRNCFLGRCTARKALHSSCLHLHQLASLAATLWLCDLIPKPLGSSGLVGPKMMLLTTGRGARRWKKIEETSKRPFRCLFILRQLSPGPLVFRRCVQSARPRRPRPTLVRPDTQGP